MEPEEQTDAEPGTIFGPVTTELADPGALYGTGITIRGDLAEDLRRREHAATREGRAAQQAQQERVAEERRAARIAAAAHVVSWADLNRPTLGIHARTPRSLRDAAATIADRGRLDVTDDGRLVITVDSVDGPVRLAAAMLYAAEEAVCDHLRRSAELPDAPVTVTPGGALVPAKPTKDRRR